MDLSDESFRRRHARVQKVETRTRNREKERLNYDVARLGDRLPQLEVMDTSNFRGDTSEEQEKDKQKVLTFARLMVNRKIDKYRSDSEDEQPSGAVSTRPAAREKKPRPPKKPRNAVQGDENDPMDGAIPKPPKAPRRKEPKYIYQPDELAFEEPYYAELPEVDEEYFEAATSSKRSKKKRKRVPEPELDPTFYDFAIPPAPAPKKSKKSGSHKKKSAFHRPVAVIPGDKSVSKLLEQAIRYNPNRQPRDIHPFGAPVPHVLNNFIDFELPEWIEQSSRPVSMQPSEDALDQSEQVEGDEEDGLYDIEGVAYEYSGLPPEDEESEGAEDGVHGWLPIHKEDLEAETSGLSSIESDENGPPDETSPRRRRGGIRY